MMDEDIKRLQEFVDSCKTNPKILNLPQLKFFRSYIESFGGVLPDSPSEPETKRTEEPEREESPEPISEPEPMSSDESEVDIDTEGVIEPEKDDLPQMGDSSKVVSEDDEMAAGEKRSEAMSIMAEDPNKAIELLTDAILLNPASAAMYAKRANVLLKQKRIKAAMQDCSQAIELNLDYAPAYKFRGRANRLLGNWIEAAKDLRMACQLDFDEQANEWLKEVQTNANKLEEHTRRYERKTAEKELEQRRKRAEKIQRAHEKAQKESTPMPTDGESINFMKGLSEDEDLMKAFSDPEVGSALDDILRNPGNFVKYKDNPKVMDIMNKMMSKSCDRGNSGGMPSGFPGMPSGFPGMPGGCSSGQPDADKTNDDLD